MLSLCTWVARGHQGRMAQRGSRGHLGSELEALPTGREPRPGAPSASATPSASCHSTQHFPK
jgi:hypothetical protein